MKINRLLALMAFAALFLSASAIVPKTENNNLSGHLDEAETRVTPKLITMEDIMEGGQTSSEKWTGLDPKRYADMSFYKKDGKTHLKGNIIDCSPHSGAGTLKIWTTDDLTASNKVTVGNINPDGRFEIDIPLNYPQFGYFELGDIHRKIFLIPDDTLSIAISKSYRIDPTKGNIPEYFGYEGKPDDGVAVNLLADSLIKVRYSFDSLNQRYSVVPSDSMKSETYRSNARLGELLDSVVTDLPVLLGDLPVSPFAKDILSALAIGEICGAMENLERFFRFSPVQSSKQDMDGKSSNHPNESLDLAELLSSRLRHKDLLYDNPLLLCVVPGLPKSCWASNALFKDAKWAACGCIGQSDDRIFLENDDFSVPYEISDSVLNSLGVGNCFAAQCVRTMSFVEYLNNNKSSIGMLLAVMERHNAAAGRPSRNRLERNNRLISQVIRRNDPDVMNDILMSEYCNYVKDVLIAENAIDVKNNATIIDGMAGKEALDKLISPYKGNFLLLDFWQFSCAPCRIGMIEQKPLLEQLADKHFKALYIAHAEDRHDESEKWLSDEGIKGEHIFVSDDDWNRLHGIFNIPGLPHCVLIDKDGKIINANYDAFIDGMKDYTELRKFMEE